MRHDLPRTRAEWEDYWRATPGLPIVAVCSIDPGHGHGFVRVGTRPVCLTCGAPVEVLAEPIQRAAITPPAGSLPPSCG